jgi:hypothetical protein
VQWFNPLSGSGLQKGTVESINGGGIHSLGNPPKKSE